MMFETGCCTPVLNLQVGLSPQEQIITTNKTLFLVMLKLKHLKCIQCSLDKKTDLRKDFLFSGIN